MRNFAHAVPALTLGLVTTLAGTADAAGLYVGIDSLSTIGSGTYNGLANPNQSRLTLLYYHGNHYHGIGTYTYTGDNLGAGTAVSNTNANNHLPETYTNLPPISLQAGDLAWGGKFRSGLPSSTTQDSEYGNLEFHSVHSLDGVDDVTYHSSSGRWDDAFDVAHIHLELISATPGLNIAVGNNLAALTVGEEIHLGDGDELFSLLPIFWVDGDGAIGSTYSAEFRLTDESGAFGESGRFFVDFQVVPEPASLALLSLGTVAVVYRRRG